ncbi:MAG: polysaccharide deacetylase family protein [Chloroherpetonaceae bacterium]|nr:polysaccharide deacetylase family protein [Chloroherpetonaceae bacterium]
MFYPKRVPKVADWLLPQCLWRKNDEAIYLTFDDAPSPCTLELLEILDKCRAKATFFLVGERIERYPDVAELIVKSGHRIANHSYSHRWDLKAEALRDEVLRTERLLRNLDPSSVAGEKLFRFPYGRFNFAKLRALSELGYVVVMWSLLSADFDDRVSEREILRLLRAARGGDIVVMHDLEKTITKLRAALPIALAELSERHSFQTL